MEFVAGNGLPHREKGICLIHSQARIAVSLRPLLKTKRHRQRANHGIMPVTDQKGFAQKDKTAALRVNRQARFTRGFDGKAEGLVGGQPPGMGFGKTAADIQGINGRQIFFIKRADLYDLCAPVGQGLDIFLIIKLKGRIFDDADGNLFVFVL